MARVVPAEATKSRQVPNTRDRFGDPEDFSGKISQQGEASASLFKFSFISLQAYFGNATWSAGIGANSGPVLMQPTLNSCPNSIIDNDYVLY